MGKGAPTFQHRHYVDVATLLARLSAAEGESVILDNVRDAFASMFERDNSKFQRSRFMACAKGTPSNGRDKR